MTRRPTPNPQTGNAGDLVAGSFSNPRQGYALLFILMMAAAIAIMLYSQMPRVAFEAQREREQLLIDRGNQYKRGIQLYVRKFNRFPADMQALENTQNIRFLRKQYIDPMTGKNEWRLIHVGPNGALLDSKVSTNTGKDKAAAPDNFITQLAPIGGGTNPNQGVNQALRRRPGDDPGSGGSSAPSDPNNPNNPNNPGAINGPVMVLPDGRIVPANSSGAAPSTGTSQPGQPGLISGQIPGQPGQIPGQTGQIPGQPSIPGQFAGGFQNTPNGPSGGAANLINQILTTPRPGGFNGLGGSNDPNNPTAQSGFTTGGLTGPGGNTGTGLPGMGGTTVGGGIAGVASKYQQEGIKTYNDQTSYDKWEFVYDMSKDKSRSGGLPAQMPPPQQQPQQQQANPALTPSGPQTPPPATSTPQSPL